MSPSWNEFLSKALWVKWKPLSCYWSIFYLSYYLSLSKNIFDDDVGEIDTRCRFHQHFTSSFWANIFLPKNFKAKLRLEKSWPKFAHKTMMKLTPSVNLINILQAAFALKFCCQKITKPNCKLHKALLLRKDAHKMFIQLITSWKLNFRTIPLMTCLNKPIYC